MSVITRFDRALAGQSDEILTGLLLLAALTLVIVAVAGPRVLKPVVLAWVVLP